MIPLSFTYPWVLLALVLPLALLVWVWKRHDRRVVLPFDHARASAGRRWRFLLNTAEMIPPLLLGIVIFILAGPQRFSEPKSKRSLTNIEFCVDVSGSMSATFGEGTRYDASMKAIDQFLSYRVGDAFGLTFFGHNVLHWCPLTTDVSAIRCAPPFMKPENVPPWMGGTMIGKALLACKDVLSEREEGDRMIVLISDGDSFDLGSGGDEELAQTLRDARITVYAIHTSETEIPAPILTVTSGTDGEAFAPDDPDALKTVFQRINELQRAEMEKTGAETMDDFAPYCMAGLSVLGLGTLALFGLRYTPW